MKWKLSWWYECFIFLCRWPEEAFEQTVEWWVIWCTTPLMCRHCNGPYFINNTNLRYAISFTHNTTNLISCLIIRRIICGISTALISPAFVFLHRYYCVDFQLQKKNTWWRYQMETFSALLALPHSPVNSPHKGQWCGALMFALICA